jgi:hypothetical protein
MISRVVSALYRFALDIARDTTRILAYGLLVLLIVAVVASPWMILLFGGSWDLLLRWYVLPYPFVLLGFGIIIAFFKRRELLVRVRDWRAGRARKSKELKKAA